MTTAEVIRDAVADVIREQGFTFELVDHIDSPGFEPAQGLTSVDVRTVRVRADLEPAMQAKTAVHELGHVLLHADLTSDQLPRLPRDADDLRAVVELEAETVAYVVCGVLGIDTNAYSVDYLRGWGWDMTPGEVAAVISSPRVHAAAEQILDRLQEV